MVSTEKKKLSIAFYWHMHQPVYKLNTGSDYLMPWVRLHAVKDYLDMLLIMDNFKELKLNFNLVPALLDALIEYGDGAYDIHSRLTVSDIKDFSNDDKEYILNNFFDADYSSMIFPHEHYNELYQKRFANEQNNIADFSEQEYSDIMALFNLTWTDKIFVNMFPELKALFEKGKDYTLEDRIRISDIHKEIIKKIILKYKEYLEKGKIELTTSPYYHPILPILADTKISQKKLSVVDSTLASLDLSEDAKYQTKLALDRMEEIFGKRPKGVWPSEQAVCEKVLDMFKDLGVEWSISDEGVLTNSIDFEFVRDFRGYLEDPYFLVKTYKYGTEKSNIKMIFRDSVILNLISFEYANHESKTAAEDLYDRIKVMQNKLQTSPDDNHLLTIALDGENCWESYIQDGAEFLNKIYTLIENDETLETVLISDYLEKETHPKELHKIHSGSWINRNFQLWIGEPVKNLAWSYLKNVKEDFDKFVEENPTDENLDSAHNELMIAEGSDWFWWYGEPNNSGQDYIFDYLFREHLKNVYKNFRVQPPKYLDLPLISVFNKPSKFPKGTITPRITGLEEEEDTDWGC